VPATLIWPMARRTILVRWGALRRWRSASWTLRRWAKGPFGSMDGRSGSIVSSAAASLSALLERVRVSRIAALSALRLPAFVAAMVG
ncbi:hypothetical protein, partial [Roseiflexus sp.]|uniref:hypothetical protein n=1 Tax=Roseiflexus sp. TaxID=2562120 RepID=UPI00398B110C